MIRQFLKTLCFISFAMHALTIEKIKKDALRGHSLEFMSIYGSRGDITILSSWKQDLPVIDREGRQTNRQTSIDYS